MTIGVVDLPAPRLPGRRWTTTFLPLACAAVLHMTAVFALSRLVIGHSASSTSAKTTTARAIPVEIRHLVFIARGPVGGGGGGGGGNGQTGPIRHAEGVGSDAMTLRVRKPPTEPVAAARPQIQAEVSLPAVVLDATPLASGMSDQIGLPVGGVTFGTSLGPGSGGGVGEGTGTGIGAGTGPGIGEGSGGGMGGGVYRAGGSVTPPRVIREIKPTYTNDALLKHIQGRVVLELVVTDAGRPTSIRVIRSLDPDGLDQQAMIAASAWEFEPGRVAGRPVNVLVTLELNFSIR